MRMALVEVIGHIIRELAATLDDEEAQRKAQTLKQLNGLYDLLLERTLDQSSYVRAKVFAVLARLCDSESAKFPQQRLLMTRSAVDSLEDKTSTVRKASITLLVRLILTHPYGIYGGFLSETEWQTRYKEASDLLAKMEGDIGKAVAVDQETGSEAAVDDDDDEGEEDEERQRGKKRRKP